MGSARDGKGQAPPTSERVADFAQGHFAAMERARSRGARCAVQRRGDLSPTLALASLAPAPWGPYLAGPRARAPVEGRGCP
eukprot:2693131-Pyramimonas_sp.AAC.1